MGRKSRAKGKAGEREVVQLARKHFLAAERTWETAQAATPAERACDVLLNHTGGHCAGEGCTRVQVKRSAAGFQSLYRALEHVDLALVRADNKPWLAVLPAAQLFELMREAQHAPDGYEGIEG